MTLRAVEVPVRAHSRTLLRPDEQALQLDLFGQVPEVPPQDHAIGEARKAEGKRLAAERNAWILEHAREIARQKARDGALVTSDDVAEVLEAKGIELGNWMGSLFDKGWEDTGQRVRSRRPAAHAREIKVWRLVSE